MEKARASVEERKVRSQDTPPRRKDGLQLRKEGQESGYAPWEEGWASAEERKVRSQDMPPGRKDGLQLRNDR